jgi:hypothetical protein
MFQIIIYRLARPQMFFVHLQPKSALDKHFIERHIRRPREAAIMANKRMPVVFADDMHRSTHLTEFFPVFSLNSFITHTRGT